MSIIQFVDRETSGGTEGPRPVLPMDGNLKYCLVQNLPEGASRNILIYTTDTQELYHGNGVGNPLKKISDVLMFNKKDEFPEEGLEDKFYLDKKTRTVYFWDEDKYTPTAEGSGEGITEEVVEDLYNLIDSMMYSGYAQEFNLTQSNIEKLDLDYKPLKDKIKVIVNGIEYGPDTFTYDSFRNIISWTWKADNGGFDLLLGWHVKVVYDFSYEENSILSIKDFLKEIHEDFLI